VYVSVNTVTFWGLKSSLGGEQNSNSFPSHPLNSLKSHPIMCYAVRSVHYDTYTHKHTRTYPADDVPFDTNHSLSHN